MGKSIEPIDKEAEKLKQEAFAQGVKSTVNEENWDAVRNYNIGKPAFNSVIQNGLATAVLVPPKIVPF